MDPLIPQGAEASRIAGVWTAALASIPAPGGPVLHMLRSDSGLFNGFGEIYFSEILPGKVKAWKRHSLQGQYFAVPAGNISVVVFDGRPGAPTRGVLERFTLGRPDDYRLLHIPPGLWYGFACLGDAPALLANCADMPHSPEESERLPLDAPDIPYSWTKI